MGSERVVSQYTSQIIDIRLPHLILSQQKSSKSEILHIGVKIEEQYILEATLAGSGNSSSSTIKE